MVNTNSKPKITFDYPQIVQTMIDTEQKQQSQEHIYDKDKSGATKLGKCDIMRSIFDNRLTHIPIKTGEKAEKGGLVTGTWLHDKVEGYLDEYFYQYKEQYPGLSFIAEIYTVGVVSDLTNDQIISLIHDKHPEVIDFLNQEILVIDKKIVQSGRSFHDIKYMDIGHKIFDTMKINVPVSFDDILLYRSEWVSELGIQIVYSPIDYAVLTDPGWILKPLHYKNQTMNVPFKHPSAEWVEIVDIKSAGDYGFWKNFSQGSGENISYLNQFHFYLHTTGCKTISVFFIHKAKAKMFVEKVPYSKEVWLDIVMKNQEYQRCEKILDGIVSYNDLLNQWHGLKEHFSIKNFSCLDLDDTIEWMFCNFSDTYEILNKNTGKPSIKLRKLCPMAHNVLTELIMKHIPLGSQFVRGKSTVQVVGFNNNEVICQRVTKTGLGQEFTDSKYDIWKKVVKKLV